jgi:peptidoglycan hydrolase-like protein with peptidoglycan-binding domain
MEHFISINYSGSVDEKYLAECLASSNRILNEDALEFYTGKVGNVKTIRMPLPEAIENVEETAQELAMRLFEFGLKKFEIELTEATLRRGSRGAEVEALQQKLGVAVDGIYGPNTEAAVRAFQQRAGIQVDGIAGGQTQAALAAGGGPRNAGAPRASTTPFQPGVGSTTQAPSQAQSAAQAPSQAQSAAPQTSPRPQARPNTGGMTDVERDAGAGAAPQTSPRPQARPNTGGMTDVERDAGAGAVSQTSPPIDGGIATGTTTGGPSQLRQRQDRRRNDQFQNDRIDRMAQQSDDQARRARNAADDDQVMSQPVVAPEPEQVSTGQSDAPVQPVGRMSSARPQGEPSPNVRPGDETNALDAIAADRATLGRNTPPRAAPEPNAQTSVVQPDEPVGTDAAPTINTADDPEVNRQAPAAPAFGGGETVPDVDSTSPSQAAPSVDPAVGQAVAGVFYQAMKGGTGIGTDERQIRSQLKRLEDANTFRAAAEAYQQENGSDLFADFYDEMNDRDFNRFVAPELRRLGIEIPPRSQYESAGPRPKGAFMFRERNEWISKYSATHNIDGSRKRQNISEGLESLEETFEDDDKFFETYGIMWYNEDEALDEAEYQGRKVKLGKPMAGDTKKFKVYVKNPKGNVVKVNFGQKGARIKKDNAARRRSFRARHNCSNPGPRHKARYWSCRKW